MNEQQIVIVNVSTIAASAPSTLQKTGAFISTESTPLAQFQSELITQFSEIQDLVKAKNTFEIAALESDGTDLTIEVTGTVLMTSGTSIELTITGAVPATFNGTWNATYEGSNTFTAATTIAASVATTEGIATLANSAADEELLVNFSSFFAQGKLQAAYVLELGPLSGSVQALTEYINNPTLRFYTYRVPDAWDKQTNFIQLAKNNASEESMMYFFIDTQYTITPGTPYASPYDTIKSVVAATKNSADDWFSPSSEIMWQLLSTSPSEVSKVAPFAYRYVVGANALDEKDSVKSALLRQNVNFIGTGAEGGVSNTIVFGGKTSDGKDLMQWYAVDWVQINVARALAKAVIDGSNTPENPLYYNQQGINTLQAAAQARINTSVTFGMTNGNPLVSCTPFVEYIKNHPSDYARGIYQGVYVSFVPNRGFVQIVFNMTVDFSGQSLIA